MIKMTDEQVLERLSRLRNECEEVAVFAQKRDKLALFQAAELDLFTYSRAIEIVQEKLDSKKPQPAR